MAEVLGSPPTELSHASGEPALDWLQSLIASAPQGMALLDADGRYLLINSALTSIYGLAAEDHLGQRIDDVLPAYADLLRPLLRRVHETGEPVRGLPLRGQTPAQLGVDRAWEIDLYPVDAPTGPRLGVAMRVTEITAQQQQRERLTQLQQLSAALAGAATVERVAEIVADRAMPQLEAEQTTLVVVGHDRERLLRYVGTGIVETPLDSDQSPAGLAVRAGQQQVVAAEDGGVRSIAYPLVSTSGTIGALEWHWEQPRDVADERAVLATAAGLCAAAVERARLADIRRQLAAGFQRSLLPASLPDLPDLELAIGYQASIQEAKTGGDWYDAFTRPDGSVVLVVGDVVGHSTLSAAVMSELRHSLRTMLFVVGDPAAALTQVDAMLTHLTTEPSVMATVAALCFEPELARVTYGLAGHPPPLLCHEDGTVVALGETPGALLGAHLGVRYGNRTTTLRRGEVLALYTDGVIERRGEGLDDSIQRLADALSISMTAASLDDAVGQIMRSVAAEGVNDDAALLLARRPPVT